MSEQQKNQQTTTVKKYKNAAEYVGERVNTLMSQGQLDLPPNYSAANALNAAWLMMQEVKAKVTDKNGKDRYVPALDVCTSNSVIDTLFGMCVQGLDPTKKQCYFIAYGDQMTLDRSYFGSAAVAKRVDPNIEDIFAEVVYKDDVFVMGRKRGKTIILDHQTKLENMSKENIVAAYATVIYKDGKEESVVMTFDQVKQSWKQSRQYPINNNGTVKPDSTHGKFPEEMSKRTVINKITKMIFNTSDDSSLLLDQIRESDERSALAEAQTAIADNAGKDFIDIEPREVAEPKPEPVDEVKPEEKPEAVDRKTGEVLFEDLEPEDEDDFPF